MSLFCDHDWQPRTGMDSGSHCSKCNKLSDREVSSPSSGLSNGSLQNRIQELREKNKQINITEQPEDSLLTKIKKSFF